MATTIAGQDRLRAVTLLSPAYLWLTVAVFLFTLIQELRGKGGPKGPAAPDAADPPADPDPPA